MAAEVQIVERSLSAIDQRIRELQRRAQAAALAMLRRLSGSFDTTPLLSDL